MTIIKTSAELDTLPPLVRALTLALAEDRADDTGIDVRTMIPEAMRLAAILDRLLDEDGDR